MTFGNSKLFLNSTMAWALFLLTLLSYFSSVHSQESLAQPASVSASTGQTVKLPCTITGHRHNFHWVRRRPGQHPQFVSKDNTPGEGIPSRFTESNSGSIWYLIINNVQAEDEADYYCTGYRLSASQWIFGGGTQLTVSGGPRSPPTVNLYCPPKEQMASEGKATLVCSITDFSPSPMETTWEVGGTAVSNGVQTTKPIKDNGKYMTSSYMTTTASDWERGDSFTCKVRHEGIDYVKTVSQSQCP